MKIPIKKGYCNKRKKTYRDLVFLKRIKIRSEECGKVITNFQSFSASNILWNSKAKMIHEELGTLHMHKKYHLPNSDIKTLISWELGWIYSTFWMFGGVGNWMDDSTFNLTQI